MAFGEGFSAQTYEQSHGPDLYRRGMYTFWKRTVPPASLATFDAPDREKCTARRALTNTPLQALDADERPDLRRGGARAGAARAARRRHGRVEQPASPTPSDWRRRASRRGKEIGVLRTLLNSRLDGVPQGSPRRAPSWWRSASRRATRGSTSAELAAWTTVASAILNLDETITKE